MAYHCTMGNGECDGCMMCCEAEWDAKDIRCVECEAPIRFESEYLEIEKGYLCEACAETHESEYGLNELFRGSEGR